MIVVYCLVEVSDVDLILVLVVGCLVECGEYVVLLVVDGVYVCLWCE